MELEKQIEELRSILNKMLEYRDSYKCNEILEISRKLDKLIYRFYIE